MSDWQKVVVSKFVVGATPAVMQAAREAAAKVARDFYAEAILKGRCDSDELVLACATAILAERERFAGIAESYLDPGYDCDFDSGMNSAARQISEDIRL